MIALSAISNGLKALASYWEYRALSYKDKLIDDLEREVEKLTIQHEKDRRNTNPSNTHRVDRLLNRIERKQKRLKYLSSSDDED